MINVNNKIIMNYSYLIVYLLIILHLVGCGNVNDKDNADVSLSLFGITFQGESQDEVMTNLIEQTDEFDYYDEERTDIKRVVFCGVPFGLNLETEQQEGITIITKITLITSHQSKAEFEAIKDSISKRLGNPDIEDYDKGIGEETEEPFYGRCTWYKEECNATLRNLHGEEGGLVVFLSHTLN
jgi:hypothetical protein